MVQGQINARIKAITLAKKSADWWIDEISLAADEEIFLLVQENNLIIMFIDELFSLGRNEKVKKNQTI